MLRDRFALALIVLTITLLLATAAWGQYTENTIYPFGGNSDGSQPLFGNLIFDASGNLYGTASYGGDTSSESCGGGGGGAAPLRRKRHSRLPVPDQTTLGCGVVFELTPGSGGVWTETVLYAFTGGNDGANPQAGLVFDSAGNLYGTTYDGGAFGFGTVFELSPASGSSWNLTTLFTFTDGDDGAYSYATPILDAAGNLYGTASSGGAGGAGVIFELTPTAVAPWNETVLYAFTGGGDGSQPETNVIFDSKGNLYGTASGGGSSLDGVVFQLIPAASAPWTENVLYSFTGGADGSVPYGNVSFDSAGSLYGTTYYGGSSTCNDGGGCGVVYLLAPSTTVPWAETVLYAFNDGSDGGYPDAGVTFDASGNLYSTASQGGTSSACDGPCFGVVFRLTAATSAPWTESVLYTFTNGTDGNNPLAGVVFDSSGNLYGTTQAGGADDNGVVFELSLPLTATTLASSLNPSTLGQTVTFTATVSPEAEGVAGNHAHHSSRVTPQTPTGAVAFTSDGTTIAGCGAVSLGSSGTAQCTTSALPVGTDAIVAAYSGDTNFAGSMSTSLPQVVEMAATSTSVASSLNPSAFDQAVTLSATVAATSDLISRGRVLRFPSVRPQTPTGTVAFTSNGATISGCGAATLSSSGTAQCTTSALPVGADAIVATYSGDGNYSGSSGNLSQVVDPVTTAAVLASSLNPSAVGQSVAFTATISPDTATGTVGFTSNGTTLSGCVAVTLSSGQAACMTSFSASGTYSIVATYSGDSNNLGSASTALSQVVNAASAPQLDLTANPSSLSVVGGQQGTVSLTISSIGTVTSTATFSCSGLPSDASCTFSPSSVSGGSLPASVTMTINTTTADARLRKPGQMSWAFAALILPGLLILPGVLALERRRVRTADSALFAILLLIAVSWVGCCGTAGGGTVGTPQSKTYTVVVAAAAPGAAGANANIALKVVQP